MGDTLQSGQVLRPGQRLVSKNGLYSLVFQKEDGNVVLYGPAGALWATGTDGKGGQGFVMQPDGNLVMWAGSSNLWASGSVGQGAHLVLQDDGNLVIWDGTVSPWSSHTEGGQTAKSGGVFHSIANAVSGAVPAIVSATGKFVANPRKALTDLGHDIGNIKLPGGIPLGVLNMVWVVDEVSRKALGDKTYQSLSALGPSGSAMVSNALASEAGKAAAQLDPLIGAAREGMSAEAKKGFDIASGITTHAISVSGPELEKSRALLSGEAKAGFDSALMLRAGRSNIQAPASLTNPAARAAFYATLGLRRVGAPADMKKAVIPRVAQSPAAKRGAKAALQVRAARPVHSQSWLDWIIGHLKATLS